MLRVAFYSSLASGRLAQLLHAHRIRWPEVELVLIETDPVQQASLLIEGQIDFALITRSASLFCRWTMFICSKTALLGAIRDKNAPAKKGKTGSSWLLLEWFQLICSSNSEDMHMKTQLIAALLALGSVTLAFAQDSGSDGGGRLNSMSFMSRFYEDEGQTKLRSGEDLRNAVQQLSADDRDLLREECKNVNSMRATFCNSFMSINQ